MQNVNKNTIESEGSRGASVPSTMTEAPVEPEDAISTASKPMSKNAVKKAAKAERLAALKLERRAREKAAKKEKQRQKAEKRAAGELDDDEEEEEKKRRAKRQKLEFGGTVVVDLGFDEMMSDKEIISLSSQLAYTYSANRNASFPFSLICTSLNGRTYDRLESLGDASYKRWSTTKWSAEGYEKLWPPPAGNPAGASEPEPSSPTSAEFSRHDEISEATPTAPEATPAQEDGRPQFPKSSFVYLTADTEDELTELKPEEVYIIGGIVDHNRYKNLCLDKAKTSGIRTARLPIGRYLESLPTRKVLTVNQVFEILIKWVETKDWEEALYSVIPKRKFHQGGKGSRETVVDAAGIEDDGEGEDSS